MRKRLFVLAGDGIGAEVTAESVKVADWLVENRDLPLDVVHGEFGYDAYLRNGFVLSPAHMRDACEADAVLFGAHCCDEYEGIDFDADREQGLLRLRQEMQAFVNLRPIKPMDALEDISPLKAEYLADVDFLIVRELLGGLYYGKPRGVETLADGSRRAVDTELYTSTEITRAATVAFELARSRRGKVTLVDKANVMASSQLWRDEVRKLQVSDFPDVELNFLFADNAALQITIAPQQFDVLLTSNMFGDILSDGAAGILGTLGVLPSASLGEKNANGISSALYEPVHGSALDIAGKNVANPLASILSLSMALRYSLGFSEEADLVEQAVESVIAGGVRTADIARANTQPASTCVFGDMVLSELSTLTT